MQLSTGFSVQAPCKLKNAFRLLPAVNGCQKSHLKASSSRSQPELACSQEQLTTTPVARRGLLATSIGMLMLPGRVGRAEADDTQAEGLTRPLTSPKDVTEGLAEGKFVPYTDPSGIFSCLVPANWKAARGLDTSTGILASWYNPDQPGAETLAIFSSPSSANTTRELGEAKDQALSLAFAAPNSILLGYTEETDEKGQVYYLARVEFDGTTAGMFGSAIETRNVIVRNGTMYFLRITTTRYRYLAYEEIVDKINAVASSFRLL